MARRKYLTVGVHEFVVPPGVTEVLVTTWGAGLPYDTGGKSAHPVTPGSVLHVYVGGAASVGSPGWNGGGAGVTYYTTGGFLFSTHGYGASDVRRGGTSLVHRVQVGGGRGGFGVVNVDGLWGEVATPEGSLYGPPEAAVVLGGTSGSAATGATAPGSYPAAYDSDPPVGPSPYSGASYPGAGGGGYAGGSSGQVWRLNYASLGHAEGWVTPTAGIAGSSHTESVWLGYFVGPFLTYSWPRDDLPDTGLATFQSPGRVDIEWDVVVPEEGWHVGRVGAGSASWSPVPT